MHAAYRMLQNSLQCILIFSQPSSLHAALIDNQECVGRETEVSTHIKRLGDQWEGLLSAIAEKTQKLKEANQQQQFNEAVKDMDFWLGEVRVYANLRCVDCEEKYILLHTHTHTHTHSNTHTHIISIHTHVHTVPQVEAQLSSEDRGRDLAGVQNLLKKHQLLEADITAHEVHTSHSYT